MPYFVNVFTGSIRYSIVNIIIEDFIVVEKHGYSVRRHLSKVNRIHGGALFSQRTTTHKGDRHRCVLLSLSVFASDSVRILAASLIIHFDKSIIISQTASLRKLSHLYYVSYHSQVYFVFRIIFSSLHHVCIIGLLDFHIFFFLFRSIFKRQKIQSFFVETKIIIVSYTLFFCAFFFSRFFFEFLYS